VRLARFDSAAAAYELVTELQPENAAAHLSLSDVYGTLGRPDDSERIKERARELTHTGKAE
jgi:cytochrome c-type biogenesis protein CcmH/NrfG